MAKVIKANATYTGGGIYQYTGKLDNGHWFQTWTDYEDYIQELDVDPEEYWDDNDDSEWQEKHTVCEHEGEDALHITISAFDWIIANTPDGNYCTGDILNAKAELTTI